MTRRFPLLVLLCAFAPPGTQAQTLYKIVTPDDRVVHTDHPPAAYDQLFARKYGRP